MTTALEKFKDRYDCIEHRLTNMFEYDEYRRLIKRLDENADIIRDALQDECQNVGSTSLDAAYQEIKEIESVIEERNRRLSSGLENGRPYYFLIEDKQEQEKPWLIGYVEKCTGYTLSWYLMRGFMGSPMQFKEKEDALRTLVLISEDPNAVVLSDVCSTNGPMDVIEKTDFVRQCLAKQKANSDS